MVPSEEWRGKQNVSRGGWLGDLWDSVVPELNERDRCRKIFFFFLKFCFQLCLSLCIYVSASRTEVRGGLEIIDGCELPARAAGTSARAVHTINC